MVLGVKNPYLKVSFNGKISLRNDNPENIIFEGEVPANQLNSQARVNLELKNRGNEYFKLNLFENALNCYKDALINIEDQTLEIAILGNSAACNLSLELYEEAVEACNKILQYQPQHLKALYRKAKAYLGLFEYEKSIQIFEALK